MRELNALLLSLLVSSAVGCGPSDQCDSGAWRCSGDAAQHCEAVEDGNGTHTEWAIDECGAGLCRTDSADAFCALDATPDPNCTFDATHVRSAHCEGATLVWCDGGYDTERQDCSQRAASGGAHTCFAVANANAVCAE